MTYTLSAFVNIDLGSFLIVIFIFTTIGFFISKKILSRKLNYQKDSSINIYSGIIGLIFSVILILAILFCLT
jgi:membrane protein DedA with SNARE-associated domain